MLSEIGKYNIAPMGNVFKLMFNDYEFYYKTPPKNPKGGVAIFIKSTIDPDNVRIRYDLVLTMDCDCTKCQVESIFLDLYLDEPYTVGCIYRHPNGNTEHFSEALQNSMSKIKHKGPVILSGDQNINLISYTNNHVKAYTDTLAELQLIPVTTIPTRITENTATCIDHFYIKPSKKLHNKTLKQESCSRTQVITFQSF